MLGILDVWKLYWPPKYNCVCLYFLASNLILHSKGILQQNSLSRNLKFYFFCVQLFHAVWSSTIGGNNCITYLLGPSPTPSMHAAAEPRELLGSPLQVPRPITPARCDRQNQMLLWPSVRAYPGTAWMASFGLCTIQLHTRIHLDHLCLCCLTWLHAHFSIMLVSRLFLQAFMRPKCLAKGDRQENAKWSVDCSWLMGQGLLAKNLAYIEVWDKWERN